jgi:salicylate hydroxylase
MSLKVLISGAGIGGLALAQSLSRSGITAEIFERDAAIDSRAQGYRIRMDADGDSALRTCLPPDLYALYQATSSIPAPPPTGAFNFQMEIVFQFPPAATAAAQQQLGMKPSPLGFSSHVTVNRHTLRQILSANLQNSIRFGHAATHATQSATSAKLHFANGTSAEGDLIVSAEGIHSPLRMQLLPDAQILDLGMTCLYGRIPLTPELYDSLPEALHSGFTPILGPHRRTMGLGPFRQRRPFADAAAEIAPRIALDPIADYLMWILVVPREQINTDATPSASAFHQLALTLTEEWRPILRALLAQADPSATFAIPIRSSQRIPPWPASRVTLLGDAIHAMTPAGGIGANTALRDAALLSYLLGHVATETITLTQAIEAYESEMCEYAFAAVERSLANAKGLYQLAAPDKPHA